MGSISSIPGHLQSVLASALQNTGVSTNVSSRGTPGTAAASQPIDGGYLSAFAQIVSTLQKLRQSNPAQYQQVTAQIATNLENASHNALAQGNTTAATQLSQLSTDFSTASRTGQLPDFQDLAKASGGKHHGHHHHAGATDGDSSAASSPVTDSSSTSVSQNLVPQSNSLDPTSIILSTLSSAGISVTSG